MKKTTLVFGLAILLSLFSNAQCFEKDTKFISAGFGLGIQHYRFTDVTNNIVGTRDTSAAIEVPFSFEYGALSFLGISLNGNYAKYLGGDSATNESVKSFDFIPTINLHAPFGWNKLDLSANVGYGFSHFSYVVNSPGGGTAKANGGVFNLGLNLRLLFRTDGHLGMNFWYTHSSYNYKKGVVTDNNGYKADFRLDGPGNNFGLGLFFRIAD
ncbi:MAG: hypothetical protein ABIQ40_16890 [Bacteroidia bacterium]